MNWHLGFVFNHFINLLHSICIFFDITTQVWDIFDNGFNMNQDINNLINLKSLYIENSKNKNSYEQSTKPFSKMEHTKF